MGCISSYSGPFGLKSHKNAVYRTLLLVLFLPPPKKKQSRETQESVRSPSILRKRGSNYVLAPNKNDFASILIHIRPLGIYFLRLPRKGTRMVPPGEGCGWLCDDCSVAVSRANKAPPPHPSRPACGVSLPHRRFPISSDD